MTDATWSQLTKLGYRILTATKGFVFRPNSNHPGGTISFGETGLEIDCMEVHGPISAHSIMLRSFNGNGVATLNPHPLASVSFLLPPSYGKSGDVLTSDGKGALEFKSREDITFLMEEINELKKLLLTHLAKHDTLTK